MLIIVKLIFESGQCNIDRLFNAECVANIYFGSLRAVGLKHYERIPKDSYSGSLIFKETRREER